MDTSANYIIQNDKNMVSQGQYFNPLTSLYLFPRGEDFSDVAVYERYDDLSGVNTQYWPYGDLGGVSSQNPYWIMNRMNRENDRRRYKLAASLQYNIIEGLNVQGRVTPKVNTPKNSTQVRSVILLVQKGDIKKKTV